MQGINPPISKVKTSRLKISKDQTCKEKNEFDLQRLRHDLTILEEHDGRIRLPLGINSLDRAMAGGLALGRAHLLSGAMEAHGAVSGFAIALLSILQNHLYGKEQVVAGSSSFTNSQSSNYQNTDMGGLIMWCPASQRSGAGMLYGHGLASAGLDPERLLVVDTPSLSQRLAALDDILRTKGLAAVVIEYDGLQKSADFWMRLARRAQLAAEESGTTAFFLGAPIAVSGFETAWQIKPAPDLAMQSNPTLVRRSIWDLTLKRARGGRTYNCRASWQADVAGLLAVDQDEISPDMLVQAGLNMGHGH